MQVQTEFSLHIPHIMWQPTLRCDRICRGCYVAASPSARKSRKHAVSDQLYQLLFTQKRLSCNQLTISLDNVENPDYEIVTAVRRLIATWFVAPRPAAQEVNVAFHNAFSYCVWIEALFRDSDRGDLPLAISQRYCTRRLGIILSKPTHASIIRSPTTWRIAQRENVTFNVRHEHGTTSQTLPNIFASRSSYNQQLHSFYYCIMTKRPLGKRQDPQEVLNAMRLKHNIITHANFDGSYDVAVLDQCITDSTKYLQTGKTCSACIDKIHIWPDNTVTGCPYDAFNLVAKEEGRDKPVDGHRILMDEIENVVVHRKKHPMQFCKIPAALQELKRQDKIIL